MYNVVKIIIISISYNNAKCFAIVFSTNFKHTKNDIRTNKIQKIKLLQIVMYKL